MRIANGCSFGDLTGEFTSHSTLGSSVIDYFVISEAILGKLLFMKVHNFMKSLSDHRLISCILSLNFTETHCHENKKYIPKPLKYIWNDKSIQFFQDALSLPYVTQKVTNYLDVDYSCKYNCSLVDSDNDYGNTSCKINQAVSDFSDIILSAANTSLKARIPQRRKNHNNKGKKWYDQSLLDMKNTLDTLSIKLAFNPFDKELRQHCFTMSKKYNKLRKAKRRAYYSDMMFKLNSLSDTNPKAFWI